MKSVFAVLVLVTTSSLALADHSITCTKSASGARIEIKSGTNSQTPQNFTINPVLQNVLLIQGTSAVVPSGSGSVYFENDALSYSAGVRKNWGLSLTADRSGGMWLKYMTGVDHKNRRPPAQLYFTVDECNVQ